MDEQEKEQLIDEIVERFYLKLPEVVGNLINNYSQQVKLNREFYAKYTEFKGSNQIVSAIIEQIESEDPTRDYEDILKDAVPRIREAIKTVGGMSHECPKELPCTTVDADFEVNGVI